MPVLRFSVLRSPRRRFSAIRFFPRERVATLTRPPPRVKMRDADNAAEKGVEKERRADIAQMHAAAVQQREMALRHAYACAARTKTRPQVRAMRNALGLRCVHRVRHDFTCTHEENADAARAEVSTRRACATPEPRLFANAMRKTCRAFCAEPRVPQRYAAARLRKKRCRPQ